MFNHINSFSGRVQQNNILSFEARKKVKDTEPQKELPGQIQYFFSDPDSFLPVRDVCNKQKAGFKTEPHIENGSENFIKPCVQHNIKSAINRGAEYLFLITRNVNKKMKDFFGNQYIVGYIKINEALERKDKEGKPFTCAKGDIRMVSYEDAIPVKEVFGENLSRVGISKFGKLDRKMTDKFARHLDSKTDITDKLIDEIILLDKDNITCQGKSCASCGNCLRWQKMKKAGHENAFVA
ncbi:MAG: hypothetical protein AB1782_15705 [Cyanobacteriota bacterium]